MLTFPAATNQSLNLKHSRLFSLTDNKGTDLLTPLPHANYGVDYIRQEWETKEGSYCAVKLYGPRAPVTGATQIVISANLALNCGSHLTTTRARSVALAPHTKVRIGHTTLAILRDRSAMKSAPSSTNMVGTQADSPTATDIIFGINPPGDAIKSVRFYDKKGVKIVSRLNESYGDADSTSGLVYHLARFAPRGTV